MRYIYKVKNIKKIDKELKKIYKVCRDCNELKFIKRFSKAKGSKDGRRNFCTKCELARTKKYNNICKECGVNFIGGKEQQFCSYECKNNNHSKMTKGENCYWYGKHRNKETKEKISINNKGKHTGENNPMYGKHHSEETKNKMSEYRLGKYSGENHPLYGKHRSEETKEKLRIANKGKWSGENNPMYGKGYKIKGENNPRYNPNLTQEERELRRNIDGYVEWRNEVFKRDNWTCQCCGAKGDINAHHINSYNWDKEHRVDIDNGVTLCEDCHREFHKLYGYGYNTKEQYEEFIKNKI